MGQSADAAPRPPQPQPQRSGKAASLVAHDMTLEGNITGGGELQVDGAIKGDVRVEHVTVGEGGHVDGGIYAEAVEVRGRVNGSITAKQVRLHGACHVDGDITHEQLAMEPGAFLQGRSLRLQRPPSQPAAPPRPLPAPPAAAAQASKDNNGLGLGPKSAARPEAGPPARATE
ncbi:MAG: bactofilin family protein [Caulobacteraceae bacterium]